MPNNNQDMLYRFLRMEGSIDAAARTVNISFSSEAPVRALIGVSINIMMKFLAMTMVMQTWFVCGSLE